MRHRLPALVCLLALGVVTAVATTAPAQAPKGAPLTLNGAKSLQVRVLDVPGSPADALDPAALVWEKVPATPLVLNRTPRVYQTEPTNQPPPPVAEARAVRAASQVVVRLSWADATQDAPQAPEAKKGEAGVAEVIYKRPTGETATFSDAAAVMLPEKWTGPAFPSLVMGDHKAPALLYHWVAARRAEIVRAEGRATTARLDQTFPTQAVHADGRWTVTLQVPDPGLDAGYPIAFAVWDGHHGDRDGLKFFSLWYVLAPGAARGAPTQGGGQP